MTFAELLADYIGPLTLDSVAEECARRGAKKIDAPYLSRMRGGTRLPPSDENDVRLIAEVCRRDPGPLVLLAMIERHPQKVIQTILEALSGDGEKLGAFSLNELAKRVKALPAIPRELTATPHPIPPVTVEVRVNGVLVNRYEAPNDGRQQ